VSKSLIVLGAVVGVFIVVLFWSGVFRLIRPSRVESARPVFVGDPKNDKRIAVRGWRPDELRAILADFAAIYELPQSFVETSPSAVERTTLLSFPRDVSDDVFFMLVNYLMYPKDHDPRDSLAVVGKVTLTAAFSLPDPSLVGRKAFVYVPDADEDYDLVYVDVAGATVYVVPFTNWQWRRAESPRHPPWLHEL
jgi:hypothetical protein